MKIGIFGTGTVGQTIAARLSELGHAVCIGTRDPSATLARADKDHYGNPPFRAWLGEHPKVELGTFAKAAAHGEVLFNASSGTASLEVLAQAGKQNMEGKVLIDISNPLDFSKGMPPTLSICNTDSLGETIQREFPAVRVVKTLNTVNAALMVAPKLLEGGAHTMFLCGNDAGAKDSVKDLLRSFGWEDLVDLGGIDNARGIEMTLPLWVRLWGTLKTPMFSLKLVR